jgi:hypothetical protein
LTPSRDDAVRWGARAIAIAAGGSLVVWAVRADARWFDRHFFAHYCAVSHAALTYEVLARVVAALSGIVVVWWVPHRLGPWLQRLRSAEFRHGAASVVVAIGCALAVSDIVLRIAAKRHKVEDEAALPPMRTDETGNYVPIPSRTKEVIEKLKRRVQYAIDADGNRAPSVDYAADPEAPTILFAGESIGIGYGVAYEKTYPVLVAAALRIQAVNLAVTRFSNDQAYLRLKAALPKFAHPVAVVTVVLPCQLERNVSALRERLALSNDGHLGLIAPSTSLFATSPLLKLLPYHSDEAIPLTAAILRATTELAEMRGARSLFVFANFGPLCVTDERGSSWLERALFGGLSAPHVAIDLPPDFVIGAPDVHPNERGHQAFADAIVHFLAAR